MTNEEIPETLRRLRRAVKRWKVPVVDQMGRATRPDPFKVLVSCILSLRTKDAVTEAASGRLFRLAGNPRKLAELDIPDIEKAIYPSAFYKNKARSLKEMCRVLLDKYDGKVPDSIDELLTLKGVGRKTANLTVTAGYGKMGICVDTHVHRICNRWGYIKTQTPDETEMALRKKLPKKYWREINGLLVAFGQNLCKPVSPHCGGCMIEEFCEKRCLC